MIRPNDVFRPLVRKQVVGTDNDIKQLVLWSRNGNPMSVKIMVNLHALVSMQTPAYIHLTIEELEHTLAQAKQYMLADLLLEKGYDNT